MPAASHTSTYKNLLAYFTDWRESHHLGALSRNDLAYLALQSIACPTLLPSKPLELGAGTVLPNHTVVEGTRSQQRSGDTSLRF